MKETIIVIKKAIQTKIVYLSLNKFNWKKFGFMHSFFPAFCEILIAKFLSID